MPLDPSLLPPPPDERAHTEEPDVSKTETMPAATEQSPVAAPLPASPAPHTDGPLPMTMPAVLRNPRVRQVQTSAPREPSAARTSVPQDGRIVGRRRVRRSENSMSAIARGPTNSIRSSSIEPACLQADTQGLCAALQRGALHVPGRPW